MAVRRFRLNIMYIAVYRRRRRVYILFVRVRREIITYS